MGYLIVGILLGVAVSWFWQSQFSGAPAFKQLMHKELTVNGQLGSVAVLKKRLEIMENKLLDMEEPSAVIEKAAAVEEKAAAKLPGEIVALPGSGRRSAARLQGADRNKNRGQVLSMWKDGKAIDDIVTRTLLGKGEIELIIALGENNLKRDSETGRV